MIRLAPALTLAVLLGPVLAGLLGTLAPAFGWLPGLGGDRLSLAPWRDLWSVPGIAQSALLSLWTGLAATLLSLALTVLIFAAWSGTAAFAWIERALSPLLSVPHAAAAFGLAFLIAPSGWIARALSPWATGWTQPPDWLITGDPWGLALIAGLVVKEVPFLILLTLAAQSQTRAPGARMVAASLGYGPMIGWVKTVFPQVYPQIRLGVFAVLAYAMSVVDVAVILGPSTPAPLAVRLVDWMRDPDLSLWFRAAAGAVLQLGLVLAALGLWRLGEGGLRAWGRGWLARGARGQRDGAARALAGLAAALIAAAVGMGLAGLALWSVAGPWRFPDVLPASLTTRSWADQGAALLGPLGNTLALALAASTLALVLVIGCLEAERRLGRAPAALGLLYLPLILPQVAFLFGLQVWAVALGVDRGWPALIATHLVFVLPYVFLSLGDPWRALDPRFDGVASALGARPARVLWAVRLPMLLRPILVAGAVGVAVSAAQYLPTLLIGGGRVPTLTTEAVALASGGNRRLIGVTAFLQSLVPLMGFALALGLPALLHANRRGLRG